MIDYCETQLFSDTHKTMEGNSGEKKKHSCAICGKSLSDKYKLAQHEKVHTGEKPYECDVCKKTLTSKYYLTTHKMVHTGEKPYECDICKNLLSA